jgi:hypothetical protein
VSDFLDSGRTVDDLLELAGQQCVISLPESPILSPTVVTYAEYGGSGEEREAYVTSRTLQSDPKAHGVAREIVGRHVLRADRIDEARVGRQLFWLAKELADEFGRDADPHWFRVHVVGWLFACFPESALTSDRQLDLLAKFVDKYRSIRFSRGEVWAMAVRAVDDESLSIGHRCPQADRLARLFRWLDRFHDREMFRLTYEKIAEALGIPSRARARQIALKLERDGHVERKPGRPRAKGDHGEATEWRWIGTE